MPGAITRIREYTPKLRPSEGLSLKGSTKRIPQEETPLNPLETQEINLRSQAVQKLASQQELESAGQEMTTFKTNQAGETSDVGDPIASASEDVGKGIGEELGTEEAMVTPLDEFPPLAPLVQAGLLIATIGTEIADLFKKHHSTMQPIITQGEQIGV